MQAGKVYTIEPRLTVGGHGTISLEEEVLVTDGGCRFLSTVQDALWIIPAESSAERG